MNMEKLVNLILPEFAFVEGSEHEKNNILSGRTVILHIRSASVIEILDRDNTFLTEGTLAYNFSFVNSFGIKEPMVATLHYSATLDKDVDREMIIKEIMKPAAQWYCEYAKWEDENILKSATKLFSVLLASKRPLITELADKLRLKYPLLPTISPCPTMRLEAIRSIIPISCRRYPKSV